MVVSIIPLFFFFFFNDTATTEIYTLSLHDALPIFQVEESKPKDSETREMAETSNQLGRFKLNRKSTRLNSSHPSISYAVFCLKKKTKKHNKRQTQNYEKNHKQNNSLCPHIHDTHLH